MAAIDRDFPDSSSHTRASLLRSRRYAMSSSGLGTVQVFGSSIIVTRFFTLSCHVILTNSFSSSEEESFWILCFFWDGAVLRRRRGGAAVEGFSRTSESEPSESVGDKFQHLFFTLWRRWGTMVEGAPINSTMLEPSESVRLIMSGSHLMIGVREIGSHLIHWEDVGVDRDFEGDWRQRLIHAMNACISIQSGAFSILCHPDTTTGAGNI